FFPKLNPCLVGGLMIIENLLTPPKKQEFARDHMDRDTKFLCQFFVGVVPAQIELTQRLVPNRPARLYPIPLRSAHGCGIGDGARICEATHASKICGHFILIPDQLVSYFVLLNRWFLIMLANRVHAWPRSGAKWFGTYGKLEELGGG